MSELGCLDWLLACQHRQTNPDTGAQLGGWAWTDLSGGVSDADDTAGALVALAAWSQADPAAEPKRIHEAARAGVRWLVDSQNRDGGWPTFCRGWEKRPLDRSGADLTAHALRALGAWRAALTASQDDASHHGDVREIGRHDKARQPGGDLDARIGAAIERGIGYLSAKQHADGYWTPLRFGNQYRADEENPIYGTAKVLAAFRDLNRLDYPAAGAALEWLMTMKHADGSWGGEIGTAARQASVEETALAVEALMTCGQTKAHEAAALQGLTWLVDAVEANRHQESSPIGLSFARLWYYEKLYPLIFSVAALGQAARRFLPQPAPPAVEHSAKT